MELEQYNKVIYKILQEFKQNESIIIDAFKTELQDYGHKIDIKGLKEILQENIIQVESIKGSKIALYYSGNVNITLYFILFAFKNNLTVTLFNERYNIFNSCIITIIEEILKELKLDNTYFKYNEKYNEKFLIDNQNEYDKIVFIGDYFEYKNLKYYIKNQMIYNNFGFIKGFIDKERFFDEYQKIMKYCYIHNIDMDFYTDENEFIEEISTEDKIVIFYDDKLKIEEIKSKISSKDVLYNEFPYDNYKLNMDNIIKELSNAD